MSPTLQSNILFYGDNLPILREYMPDESVDLIYLDPPPMHSTFKEARRARKNYGTQRKLDL